MFWWFIPHTHAETAFSGEGNTLLPPVASPTTTASPNARSPDSFSEIALHDSA